VTIVATWPLLPFFPFGKSPFLPLNYSRILDPDHPIGAGIGLGCQQLDRRPPRLSRWWESAAAKQAAAMEHVQLALRETGAEWEARIRASFTFFDPTSTVRKSSWASTRCRIPRPRGGTRGSRSTRALLPTCDCDL
jgi:hypothetical protein